jgi:hypothetical protein
MSQCPILDTGAITMTPADLKKAVEHLIHSQEADAYVYSADIASASVERLRRMVCAKKNKRQNAVLFLTTPGGDPDAAYRLAACFQRAYKNFAIYVFGSCKSAGTLAALGAASLVFGDFGELGPLDVQLAKRDEIMARNSGLDIFQAIAVLNNSAFECFEQCFLSVIAKSAGNISAKMAADIATQMAVGLFSPMTAQIDPERLGEVQRAVNIANAYGEKLGGANLKKGAIETLVEGYPSHSFVIDFREASKLFHRVREGTANENAIADGVPGIRNRTDVNIVLDLEELVGTVASKGAANVATPQPQASAKSVSGRAGGRRSGKAAPVKRDASGDHQAAEENPDPVPGVARARSPRGRSAAGPRLVRT